MSAQLCVDAATPRLTSNTALLPEDCDRILVAASERGDLETLVDLYEPGAILHRLAGGKPASTRDEIRQEFVDLLAINPRFEVDDIIAVTHGDGTLATTRMRCNVYGHDSEGAPIQIVFHTLEVVRKQADGSWRYAIDDPNGSARS